MKRLKIRESQGIETVETLGAGCPFYVRDDYIAYYDPARQALVKLAPHDDPAIESWPSALLGEGRYVLTERYLPGGPRKGDRDPENYRLALRNLLTGEVTDLPESIPYRREHKYVFTTDMKYCFYRKVWADDPSNLLFNERKRLASSLDYNALVGLRYKRDVHTALYRCNLETGQTEELLNVNGISDPIPPALTVNPQGTIVLVHLLLLNADPTFAALIQYDAANKKAVRPLRNYELESPIAWSADGNLCNFIEPHTGALQTVNFETGKRRTINLNKGLLAPGSGAQDGAMFIHGIANDGRVYASGEKGNTLIIQLIDPNTNEREELFRITSEEIKYATFAQNTKDFYLKPAD